MHLRDRIDAAEGVRKADLVLRGGQLVNVATGEIYPADVALAGDVVAAVGDVRRAYRTGHDGHRRHGPLHRPRPHRRPHPHRVLQVVDHHVRRRRRPLRDDERHLRAGPDIRRCRAPRCPGRPIGGRRQPDEDLLGRALQGAVHDPRDERRLPPRP